MSSKISFSCFIFCVGIAVRGVCEDAVPSFKYIDDHNGKDLVHEQVSMKCIEYIDIAIADLKGIEKFKNIGKYKIVFCDRDDVTADIFFTANNSALKDFGVEYHFESKSKKIIYRSDSGGSHKINKIFDKNLYLKYYGEK